MTEHHYWVAFISFLDEKKLLFYKELLQNIENDGNYRIYLVARDIEVLQKELGEVGDRCQLLAWNDPGGFINVQEIKKLCEKADAVFFDDFRYEIFYKYFVHVALLGQIVIIPQSCKLSFLSNGVNCFVIQDYKAAELLEVARQASKLPSEKRSQMGSELKKLGEKITGKLLCRVKNNDIRSTKDSPRLGNRLVLFYDNYIEEKNQRYYRHCDFLRKKWPDITVMGVDYSNYADWKKLFRDTVDEEDFQFRTSGTNGSIGIPFNNIQLGAFKKHLPFLDHFYNSLTFFFGVHAATRSREYDVCFAHSVWAGLAAVFLKKMGRVRSIVYEDLDYYPGFYDGRSVPWYLSKAEKIVLENSDIISCVSKELEILRKRQTSRPVIHSSNGVDWEAFKAVGGEQPVETNTVIYAGTLDKWSGIDVLVEAISLLREKRGEVKLIVIGKDWKDGFYSGEIIPLIKENKLEGSVLHIGSKDYQELPLYLKRASVGVIPNRPIDLRRYSCPLKLFDYAACGLPVVCTDIGEMGRLVKENGIGISTAFDKKNYAEALEKILTDRELRQGMVGNCLRFAERNDWNKVFEEELFAINQHLALDRAAEK